MMDGNMSPDFPEYVEISTEVWDRIAEWWDDQIGEGNAFQDILEPITERMLEPRDGKQVLDIACGAGRFARRLAASGANVIAIDQCDKFIRRARRYSEGSKDGVDYRVMNTRRSHNLEKTACLACGRGYSLNSPNRRRPSWAMRSLSSSGRAASIANMRCGYYEARRLTNGCRRRRSMLSQGS